MGIDRAVYAKVQRWRRGNGLTKFPGVKEVSTQSGHRVWIVKPYDDEMRKLLTAEEIKAAVVLAAEKNGHWITETA